MLRRRVRPWPSDLPLCVCSVCYTSLLEQGLKARSAVERCTGVARPALVPGAPKIVVRRLLSYGSDGIGPFEHLTMVQIAHCTLSDRGLNL